MVDSQIDDSSHTGQIVLKPNASFSWRANLFLLYTLMAISLVIGLGFAIMGAWM
ncbi:MAG: putative membrane protein, partial [Litorivivens sp.]